LGKRGGARGGIVDGLDNPGPIMSGRKIAAPLGGRGNRNLPERVRRERAVPLLGHKPEQLVAVAIEMSRNKDRAASRESGRHVAVGLDLLAAEVVDEIVGVHPLAALEPPAGGV